MYYAAACQTSLECPRGRREIISNTLRMCEMAKQAITAYEPYFDVRLLVFPEFAHAAPIYDNVPELRDRLGVQIPNEHTDRYCQLTREYGCYVQSGTFLEIDDNWPDVIFNTTVLLGPNGILAKYRKVNPWIPWEIHASPHDLPGYDLPVLPVVKTELGNLAVAICYDWLFPETIRQLVFDGAEVLLRVSAYMDPWGAQEPGNWWSLVNRTRALENTCYVVAANQGATLRQFPPFSWPGGSMVVDYDGRVLAQAEPGPGERVVVAPINIPALRHERERRLGHDTRAQLRSELYGYLQTSKLAKTEPSDHPLTKEVNERRIRDAAARLPENQP